MPWNEDDNSDHGQSTSGEYATVLKARMRDVLMQSGHRQCEYLSQASYDPASGSVVCGCGVFEPWPQDQPQSPPWDEGERSDAAEGREFDGPIGDGQQGPAGPPPARRAGNTVAEAADPIRSTLALIDTSQLYTPDDVERHILDTLFRLETGQLFERESVTRYYDAKQLFDRKFFAKTVEHKALRTDQCKAQAMVDCDPEYAAMLEAEMVMKAVKATMHNLRAVLSGYQSTARSVGATYNAGGSQGAAPPRDRSPW